VTITVAVEATCPDSREVLAHRVARLEAAFLLLVDTLGQNASGRVREELGRSYFPDAYRTLYPLRDLCDQIRDLHGALRERAGR
jgi:hypothetical protein